MFKKRLNFFFLLFTAVSSSWLEECPERRKSLGRCLAGLCPFEAECIDDHCCMFTNNLGETLFSTLLKLAGEFPKLPMIKPEGLEINETQVTEKPVSEKATVPMLPFEKIKPSESAEEEDNKPLTSEELKQAATPPSTTTTTTTTTRRPKNKKRPTTKSTTTTTTTTPNPITSSTEDPLCFDGSYSIGECMDGYCPDGYACENGYCCKCQSLPCGKEVLLTTHKQTNIFTLTPDSFESSTEASEEEEEENEDLATTLTSSSLPPIITITTTKKPKMKKHTKKTTQATSTHLTTTTLNINVSSNKIVGTSPPTTSTIPPSTTTILTTTEEDYSTKKDICLEGYPIGECVDGKCPESHECIQNYCCEITAAINCSDLVRSCKKHLCNKIQYLSFMTEQCGRTCRRCDQQNQANIIKPKRPRRCRDSRNDCEEWAAEGFCKSALYSLEQKRHLCGKSCKLC